MDSGFALISFEWPKVSSGSSPLGGIYQAIAWAHTPGNTDAYLRDVSILLRHVTEHNDVLAAAKRDGNSSETLSYS